MTLSLYVKCINAKLREITWLKAKARVIWGLFVWNDSFIIHNFITGDFIADYIDLTDIKILFS